MKGKKFNKKLFLNKKTIADLEELKDVRGGVELEATFNPDLTCTSDIPWMICCQNN